MDGMEEACAALERTRAELGEARALERERRHQSLKESLRDILAVAGELRTLVPEIECRHPRSCQRYERAAERARALLRQQEAAK